MRHRHALYLSEAMTQRLQLIAETHRLAEVGDPGARPEALPDEREQRSTARSDQHAAGVERPVAAASRARPRHSRRVDSDIRALLCDDYAAAAGDEHEAARALGQLRFDQVIESVANRLKTDRGLIARVMAMVDQSHAHELHADSQQPGEAHAPSTTDAVPGRHQRQILAMDDLFAYAQRQAPQATDEELWSIKIVRMKTGLSRASVYNYIALGLFPRQRRIGPGRVAWRASEVRTWIEGRPE